MASAVISTHTASQQVTAWACDHHSAQSGCELSPVSPTSIFTSHSPASFLAPEYSLPIPPPVLALYLLFLLPGILLCGSSRRCYLLTLSSVHAVSVSGHCCNITKQGRLLLWLQALQGMCLAHAGVYKLNGQLPGSGLLHRGLGL